MRGSCLLLAVATLITSAQASADTTDFGFEVEQLFGYDADPPPKFAFSNGDFYTAKVRRPSIGGVQIGETSVASKTVVATSKDGSVAWVASDVTVGCVEQAGDECMAGIGTPLHATGVLLKAGKDWQWIAWHFAEVTTAKEQAALVKNGVVPGAIPRSVTGAEDVVAVFEKSFADPKELAASVSTRKDVVLYGSSVAERVVGGAKVKAKLKGWNLSFKVRDGIQAGLVGTTVGWVAANVDAAAAKGKPATSSPYRVLAVYEKSGSAWKLVQVHFSVDQTK
ncbi:MAG TPA: nuclear transport factor 2 family protein [Kofleriaceae bacterium]|nr:nuclear transport factor 2 family protein [Kofleriaceae bacterium]